MAGRVETHETHTHRDDYDICINFVPIARARVQQEKKNKNKTAHRNRISIRWYCNDLSL